MRNAGGHLSGFLRRDHGTSWRFPNRGLRAAAFACALSLTACGTISEKMSTTAADNSLIGLPANTPARPEQTPAFPAVHDMPVPRINPMLTSTEQIKMEEDLVAARERLDGTAEQKAAEQAAKKAAAEAAAQKAKRAQKGSANAVPAASRTIY